MKCKLTPQLSSDDWKDFCSRFHFSPADLPYIKAIYTALLPLVESCAYYSLDQNLDGIFLPHYAYGFVTLGNGIDELSELYLNHEQIQEAYIVDCVSLLLVKSIRRICTCDRRSKWFIPCRIIFSRRYLFP